MESAQLKPFSYVVLALVGRHGAGAHDIAAMMSRSSIYWSAARSQWFAEPKRLAELGLLAAREQPGRTHARTQYTLTSAGLEGAARMARPARGVHPHAKRGRDPPARRRPHRRPGHHCQPAGAA